MPNSGGSDFLHHALAIYPIQEVNPQVTLTAGRALYNLYLKAYPCPNSTRLSATIK
uniref:Uncharacterized protein n=1 Tax=Magallana gigas TaxID=29159 RepID=K1PWZ4_MAGGI